jgi:putative transposase
VPSPISFPIYVTRNPASKKTVAQAVSETLGVPRVELPAPKYSIPNMASNMPPISSVLAHIQPFREMPPIDPLQLPLRASQTSATSSQLLLTKSKGCTPIFTVLRGIAGTGSVCRALGSKIPINQQVCRSHRHNLNTLFSYPEDIRKVINTTNAIESLNSVIRKAVKKWKLFSTDDSALKVIYLAIQQASKKWTMPNRNWKLALNRFMIEFEDQLEDYI